MKSLAYISALFFMLLLSSGVWAQGSNPLEGRDSLVLENERINEVIDSDKPKSKIKYQEIKQGKDQEVKFDSKPFKVEVDFEPADPTVRPIEFEKEEEFTNNILKVGIGRYTTPFVDLYVNNGEDRSIDYGLVFRHLSAHTDEVNLRNFRQNTLSGKLSTVEGDNEINGGLYFYNTGYWNYAGDDSLLIPGETQFREDSLRMSFTRYNAFGNIASVYDPDRGYFYNAGLDIRGVSSKRGNSEAMLALTPGGGFYFTDEANIGVESKLQFIRGNLGTIGQNRFFFEINPAFQYQNDKISLKAGVNYAHFNRNVDSMGVSNLAPDVQFAYQLIPGSLTVLAGVTGGMTNNTYYDMIYQNPYLSTEVDIKPTRERLHFFAGIKGNLNQSIDFSAQAYHKRIENQLMYRSFDSVFFTALYDSFTTISGIHAELNHDVSKNLLAGAAMTLNVFTTSGDSLTDRFYHGVPLRLDAFAVYKTLEDKLSIRADINFYAPTPVG
ncbi:MAG: hypothetical protein AAFY71_24015, partial [Bacteroidota bacterium]